MYFNYALKNLIYMFPEYEDLFKNNYDKVISDLIGEDLANFQYDVININSLIKLPNENKNLIHLASICYVLIEKYNKKEKNILTIISSLENIPKNSLQTIYKKLKIIMNYVLTLLAAFFKSFSSGFPVTGKTKSSANFIPTSISFSF